MKELIAFCGLDCGTCDARIATLNNDDALRERTAELWTKLNGVPITAGMINCVGCRAEGVKTPYSQSLCPIRQCALEKGHATCGDCPELDSCPKVGAIHTSDPAARERLKHGD